MFIQEENKENKCNLFDTPANVAVNMDEDLYQLLSDNVNTIEHHPYSDERLSNANIVNVVSCACLLLSHEYSARGGAMFINPFVTIHVIPRVENEIRYVCYFVDGRKDEMVDSNLLNAFNIGNGVSDNITLQRFDGQALIRVREDSTPRFWFAFLRWLRFCSTNLRFAIIQYCNYLVDRAIMTNDGEYINVFHKFINLRFLPVILIAHKHAATFWKWVFSRCRDFVCNEIAYFLNNLKMYWPQIMALSGFRGKHYFSFDAYEQVLTDENNGFNENYFNTAWWDEAIKPELKSPENCKSVYSLFIEAHKFRSKLSRQDEESKRETLANDVLRYLSKLSVHCYSTEAICNFVNETPFNICGAVLIVKGIVKMNALSNVNGCDYVMSIAPNEIRQYVNSDAIVKTCRASTVYSDHCVISVGEIDRFWFSFVKWLNFCYENLEDAYIQYCHYLINYECNFSKVAQFMSLHCRPIIMITHVLAFEFWKWFFTHRRSFLCSDIEYFLRNVSTKWYILTKGACEPSYFSTSDKSAHQLIIANLTFGPSYFVPDWWIEKGASITPETRASAFRRSVRDDRSQKEAKDRLLRRFKLSALRDSGRKEVRQCLRL